MNCYSAICKSCLIIFFVFLFTSGSAQGLIHCEKAAQILPDIEKKISKISTTNPELISLHYLLIQDIEDEIKVYQTDYLPQLHLCPDIDFYKTVHYADSLLQKAVLLEDTLNIQRKRVDVIFYEMAQDELFLFDTALANYYLDRSIQYNPLQTDALILKMKLLFVDYQYDECIKLIHILYNDAPLQREHEIQLSDFTAQFYDKLFQTGDSLIKIDHAADALTIFQTLETFCHDMPSTYCNDDYYHGIIRSKTGVYESYLTIAKVAYKKKNYDIAYKFLDYAEEYLNENSDNIVQNEEFVQFKNKLQECRELMLLPADSSTIDYSDNYIVNDSNYIESQKVISTTFDTKDAILPEKEVNVIHDAGKEIEYNHLFIDALYYSLNDDYEKAFVALEKAIALEECSCFEIDSRVRVLYNEYLKNIR